MKPPADAVHETWESIEQKSVELARMIEAHCKKSGEQFDAMLLVPRGSYYPANIVSRLLGFGATDMLHACIGSYDSGATKRNDAFDLGQMPKASEVKGKNILIIEEVCETGHTLKFLVGWLKSSGAKNVKTGVLHYKPGRNQTDFRPDWYTSEVDKWIVYPWEVYEPHGEHSVARRAA